MRFAVMSGILLGHVVLLSPAPAGAAITPGASVPAEPVIAPRTEVQQVYWSRHGYWVYHGRHYRHRRWVVRHSPYRSYYRYY